MEAAAAPAGSDWRSQIDGRAREVMVKRIMETLKEHLPMPDQEGLDRLHNIAVGYETKFYNTGPSKPSYLRKIAMLLLYVENPNPNPYPHQQAPGLPPHGNDPAQSSGVPLMSQQKTQQGNTSTSVKAASLPGPGQRMTNVSEASALQDMSKQSAIPRMQLMAIHSATQSGNQQNPLSVVQQHMLPLCQQPPQCFEQQSPQLSMHQQPSLQQAQLTEQPSFPLQQQKQQLMSQQPNLYKNQLFCQQNSAVDMLQQQRPPIQSNNHLNPQHPYNIDTENLNNLGFDFINSHSVSPGNPSALEAGIPRDHLPSSVELGILEDNAAREHVITVMPTCSEMETDTLAIQNEESTLSDEELFALWMVESLSPLFSVQASPLYAESMPFFPRIETHIEQELQGDWAASSSSLASDTHTENSNNKANGSLAWDNLNYEGATNLKKRKLDVPCSSVPDEPTLDDYSCSQGGPQLYHRE